MLWAECRLEAPVSDLLLTKGPEPGWVDHGPPALRSADHQNSWCWLYLFPTAAVTSYQEALTHLFPAVLELVSPNQLRGTKMRLVP